MILTIVVALSALAAISVGAIIYAPWRDSNTEAVAVSPATKDSPSPQVTMAAIPRTESATNSITTEKKHAAPTQPVKPVEVSVDRQNKPPETSTSQAGEKQIVPDPISPILIGHTGRIDQVRFLPNGRRAISLANDGTVRLWNLITGKPEKSFSREKIDCFDISPDLKHLAIGGSAHKAYLFELETGKPGAAIQPFTAGVVSSLAFSADNSRLYVGLGTGRLWAIRSSDGEHLQFHHVFDTVLSRIRLLPGGRQALCSSAQQGPFALWDFVKGEVRRFDDASHHTLDIALFADGKRAASIDSDGSAHIWSLETAAELAKFKAHSSKPNGGCSIHVLHGDQWLLTTGDDKTIRIWDLKSHKKICEQKSDGLLASVADVSPDGRLLLTGSSWRANKADEGGEFNLRLWRLPTP